MIQKTWRWVILGAGLAVVFLLIFLQARPAWRATQTVIGASEAESAARQKVTAELLRIVQAGEPLSPEELESHYALPDGATDATEEWVAGTDPFFTVEFETDSAGIPIVDAPLELEVPPPGEPWAELPAAREFLASHRTALDQLINTARDGGTARFRTDFAGGIGMEFPHLLALLAAARTLALEAHVSAHDGNEKDTAEAIRTILAGGKCLESYPSEVAQLVCVATYGQAFLALDALLHTLGKAELERMKEALEACDFDIGPVSAMLGERVIGHLELQRPLEFVQFLVVGDVETSRRLTQETADGMEQIAPLVIERDRWHFLNHMRKVIAAAREPLPNRLTRVEAAIEEWRALGQRNKMKLEDFESIRAAAADDRAILAHMLAPASLAIFEASARAAAARDILVLAIAIRHFQTDHGVLPSTLQQLEPEYVDNIPIDPFDGQHIRFVRDTDVQGRIYSIGRDREDDGGTGSVLGVGEDIVCHLGWPMTDQ